ncbi:MAG: Cof-type HAD-IIB family hydrolase [Bacillaceae bacterium]|nr:Cof-type HAD-IIB family hydrolase [Bacillaceae bacterium]
MDRKRIVFFDIDGTLLDEHKEIPEETIEAVHDLKDKGVLVAIATGRAPFMYDHIRKRLGIDSFISFNGQLVVLNGKVIFEEPLPKNELESLWFHAKKRNHPMVYLDETTMTASEPNHPFIAESIGSLKLPYPKIDPNYFKKKPVYQALIFCEDHEEKTYFSHDSFRFVRWHQYSTDVLPAKGSKARGIQKMLEYLGIDKENSFAFGDGLNDMEMLEFVGTGVAMGNGHPTVKKVADVVTDHVSKSGIVKGLKIVGLL